MAENQRPLSGKKAIICGGSKGIGKETAKEVLRLGGSVGIVARGEEGLREAVKEMEQNPLAEDQFIETVACDAADFDALKPHFDSYVTTHGVPDYLINCVGYAYPNYVQEYTLDDYKQNMNANYYGQLVPTLIMLPYLIEAKSGHIAFISSVGGLGGVYGYATYSPTKFAIAGLAEVLRWELKPYNINVSVMFPPDTDTPGLEIENQTKPPETEIISGLAKITTPEIVAKIFVKRLLRKKFIIIFGEAIPLWIFKRISPRLFFWFMDMMLKSARRKLGKA